MKPPQYEKYFSRFGLKKKNSPLRAASDEPERHRSIFMSGGYPNPQTFPIKSTEITLTDGTKLTIGEEAQQESLQYGSTWGIDELRDWLKELQKRVHNPPTLGIQDEERKMELMMIAGCQDGLNSSFQMFLNEGDTILVQKPSYPTVFSMVIPLGCTPVGIESDDEGIMPDKMRSMLQNWAAENPVGRNAPKPKLLYCITTGENPRSLSWSLTRRKAIYAICREFDLLIMEDDPYYYTYFTRPLPRTLLSLDEDGRVLRFESFSKVCGPGLRLGHVSGPKALITKLIAVYQSSSAMANPVSQMILLTILRHWGYEGFHQHCEKAAKFLKNQASYITDSATTFLSDLAEWNVPDSGMFLWVRFKDVADATGIVERCSRQGVFIVSGFHALAGEQASAYVRVAYALASREQIKEACRIMAGAAREELSLKGK